MAILIVSKLSRTSSCEGSSQSLCLNQGQNLRRDIHLGEVQCSVVVDRRAIRVSDTCTGRSISIIIGFNTPSLFSLVRPLNTHFRVSKKLTSHNGVFYQWKFPRNSQYCFFVTRFDESLPILGPLPGVSCQPCRTWSITTHSPRGWNTYSPRSSVLKLPIPTRLVSGLRQYECGSERVGEEAATNPEIQCILEDRWRRLQFHDGWKKTHRL